MEKIDEVKNIIAEFWRHAGIIDFEIKTIEAAADGSLNVSVFIHDASLYIGEDGRNIRDFETALRLIIKKYNIA